MSKISKSTIAVNELPHWELKDIYHLAKTRMEMENMKYQTIIVNNFQVETDEDDIQRFECYQSVVGFSIEDSYQEFFGLVMESERLVKEYKGLKSMLNACIKNHKSNNSQKFDFAFINII